MALIDMVIVPTKLMPFEPWERDLFESYETIQLFSLDLYMGSKVFTHDADGRLIMDGKQLRIEYVMAFGSTYNQGGYFTNLDETSDVLEGVFELVYDDSYRLKEIKKVYD